MEKGKCDQRRHECLFYGWAAQHKIHSATPSSRTHGNTIVVAPNFDDLATWFLEDRNNLSGISRSPALVLDIPKK